MENNLIIYKEEAQALTQEINYTFEGSSNAIAFFEKIAKGRKLFSMDFAQLPEYIKYLFRYKLYHPQDPVVNTYMERYEKCFNTNDKLRLWVSNRTNENNNKIRAILQALCKEQVKEADGAVNFYPTQEECLIIYKALSKELAHNPMLPSTWWTTRKKVYEIWAFCFEKEYFERNGSGLYYDGHKAAALWTQFQRLLQENEG